jgi:hypothetical protein
VSIGTFEVRREGIISDRIDDLHSSSYIIRVMKSKKVRHTVGKDSGMAGYVMLAVSDTIPWEGADWIRLRVVTTSVM